MMILHVHTIDRYPAKLVKVVPLCQILSTVPPEGYLSTARGVTTPAFDYAVFHIDERFISAPALVAFSIQCGLTGL